VFQTTSKTETNNNKNDERDTFTQNIMRHIQQRLQQTLISLQRDLISFTKELEYEREVNNFLLMQLQHERQNAETLLNTIKELQQQIETLSDKETKSTTFSISFVDLLPEVNLSLADSESQQETQTTQETTNIQSK
jgi:hypothetical protein